MAFALASCAVLPSQTERQVIGEGAFAEAPQDQPGLGTRWGEHRKSVASVTSFERASPNKPLATAAIFYNDHAGIEAMAAVSQLRRVWPVLSEPASSLVSVGLRDQGGRFLPGLIVGDRWLWWAKKDGAIPS